MENRPRQRMTRPCRAALLSTVILCLGIVGIGSAQVRVAAVGPPHGGTLRIGLSGDMTTFDPAQAANDDWLVLQGTLFNGLYRIDRTGKPQPDLAARAPTVSTDHKTWTFALRHDVLFSNGLPLTANDVKYTLTRVLDPHLKPAASWGQSIDAIFEGATDLIAGKTQSVAGIQVLDRYTIRFVLTQPVAVFPYILAESFNFIVPQAVVAHESAQAFAAHPIGTGPFLLQSWQKGVQAVFVRNRHYFRTGKPYVDRVIVQSNVAPNVIALRVEKGELDGFGFAPEMTAADRAQAQSNPVYERYLIPAPVTQVVWLNLNTHARPLNSLLLRQAIALAIDRAHLVKLLGGNALPATQLYDPLESQYDPRLVQNPVYGYDPVRARALVRASGYHGQQISILYANDLQRNLSLAPGVQQDLQQISLNVSLRGVTDVSLGALRSAFTGHQIDFNGWAISYPDAYDIYSGEMSCGNNGAGGASGAHYCDPGADRLANRAESLPLGLARDDLLRQAQRRILQSAARVPLVFLKSADLVSPHVGGFYYHPIYGWQYEDYWIQR